MANAKWYGHPPYRTFVIHGGPTAAGEMAPVARVLSESFGVIEPFQRKSSIYELVEELKEDIEEKGEVPIRLVGFSWGAWLSYVFASMYPQLISKLILVGSGPFEEEYAKHITAKRNARLTNEELRLAGHLEEQIAKPNTDVNRLLKQYGKITSKADTYAPLDSEDEEVNVDVKAFQSIWNEASEWRANGKLLAYGKQITCPVVAIHGDYDPHPYEGVIRPLQRELRSFHYYILDRCGHKPWRERFAKDEFFRILTKEL